MMPLGEIGLRTLGTSITLIFFILMFCIVREIETESILINIMIFIMFVCLLIGGFLTSWFWGV